MTRLLISSDALFVALFGAGVALLFFPIYILFVLAVGPLEYIVWLEFLTSLVFLLIKGAAAAWVAARVCFYPDLLNIRPFRIVVAAFLAMLVILAFEIPRILWTLWWWQHYSGDLLGSNAAPDWDQLLFIGGAMAGVMFILFLPLSLLLARNLHRRALVRLGAGGHE